MKIWTSASWRQLQLLATVESRTVLVLSLLGATYAIQSSAPVSTNQARVSEQRMRRFSASLAGLLHFPLGNTNIVMAQHFQRRAGADGRRRRGRIRFAAFAIRSRRQRTGNGQSECSSAPLPVLPGHDAHDDQLAPRVHTKPR